MRRAVRAPFGVDRPPVTSIYLWGRDRSHLNTTARVLAARLDPKFSWIEAIPPETSRGEEASAERFTLTCGPGELTPMPGVSPERLWAYLKPRGQRRAAAELEEFLRMPEPIQRAISSLLSSERSGPRLLVIANVDLVSAVDLGRPRFVSGFIEFLNSHDISILVTATGRPQLERIEFEYSFTTSESLPQRFRTDAAVCQWGDCDACIVRLFPEGELVCISRLVEDPTSNPPRGRVPGWAASH